MTLAADEMDSCVIFLSFLSGPDVTTEEWMNLREEDKPKTLGEFEPLKLLNISVAVSEPELNELEHVQINFDNNPEWKVRRNAGSGKGLTRTQSVCLCLDKCKIFYSTTSHVIHA